MVNCRLPLADWSLNSPRLITNTNWFATKMAVLITWWLHMYRTVVIPTHPHPHTPHPPHTRAHTHTRTRARTHIYVTQLKLLITKVLTCTVYPKKYAHGFCFAVLCCGYTLTDFPISIRLTSLALWQSNDCPSASKATLMNMDKYFMWIHYERLHNHNKANHNKTVCIFLGIYCTVSVIARKSRGLSSWLPVVHTK